MCRLMLSRSVGRVHISSARVGIGFGLGDFNFDEVSSSSLPVFCLCLVVAPYKKIWESGKQFHIFFHLFARTIK